MNQDLRVRIRDAYRAFNEGDLDAVMPLLDERIELRPPPSSIDPEPRFGLDAVRQYLAPDLFESQEATPIEVLEKGDLVLVTARLRARGRTSGIELDDVAFHLWTLADDKAVKFEVFVEREEAMAALAGQHRSEPH
jgi:ketosteroid isomerase-like protein